MSRRKDRWAAVALPGLRRGLVSGLKADAERVDQMIASVTRSQEMAKDALGDRRGDPDLYRRATDRTAQLLDGIVPGAGQGAARLLDPDSAARLTEHAAYLRETARVAQLADLFWVTAPMTRAAMDAAEDVPSLSVEDDPSRFGLIAFGTPLPPKDTTGIGGLALRDEARTDIQHDDPVIVDGMLWARRAGEIDIQLLCRPERLPLPMFGTPLPLVPFMQITSPIPADLASGVPALGPDGVSISSDNLGVLSLLSACWVLMMTPTVAQRQTLDARTGATSAPRPPSPERRDDVHMVDLRPLRHVRLSEAEPGESGRKLTVRHMVRGHWTNQPYGPNRELRRKQWIASYIKGPEGAPWSTAEKVMVWRR